MAKFSKSVLYQKLKAYPIVPLFYHSDVAVCQQVLLACYEGGTRVIEFTNRGANAPDIFASLVTFCEANCPDMALGIGTIFDAKQALAFVQMGADFIVQPIMNPAVGEVCTQHQIHWIPGVATLTEIYNAQQHGAEVVKLFPGHVLGPDFVRSLKGPMPQTQLMVTGGVEPTPESLKAWFGAGALCVGLGSNLLPKSLLETGDFTTITQQVSHAMQLAAALQS